MIATSPAKGAEEVPAPAGNAAMAAHARLLRNDPRDRFVIDMASLKAA